MKRRRVPELRCELGAAVLTVAHAGWSGLRDASYWSGVHDALAWAVGVVELSPTEAANAANMPPPNRLDTGDWNG